MCRSCLLSSVAKERFDSAKTVPASMRMSAADLSVRTCSTCVAPAHARVAGCAELVWS
jgi:hypothetical protein